MDGRDYIIVSTVPTLGYAVMSGLIQVAVFVLCAFAAVFLLKRAGFDLLSFMRGGELKSSNKNGKKTNEKSNQNPDAEYLDLE